jgi:putative endonuclease
MTGKGKGKVLAAAQPAKMAAERFGRRGEWLAAALLHLKGYRILARGFRTLVGEIDLIARRGDTVAFVEVKARRGSDGVDAVTPRQRQRIARAAAWYVAQHPALATLSHRFDLIVVGRGPFPAHLPGAWRSDD